jgi:long-chain acyl-CoA synthetase
VAAADDLAPAVVRPSIVMGESDSGWTPAFNVLYWPLRAFSRRLFDTVPALGHGRVDVVPVDYVADGIVYLLDHSETGVFNLVAGHAAPTVDELIDLGTERFGIPRPELVEPGEPTALADGEVYVPYFDMQVVFDDTRAREVLEPAGIHATKIADCFGNLIDYAEETRWGKRPMSRQAARERREPAAA